MPARSEAGALLVAARVGRQGGHVAPERGEREEREEDERLIGLALDGDRAALEALLVRHEAPVLRVLRLLGVPRDDREDVAQDVFVRVVRHLDGFRRGQPFGGWLYRIAVNAAHDHRARAGRRTRLAVESAAASEPADEAATQHRDVEAADLRRRLEAALTELSDRERAVFVLAELEGLSTRELGRALGISAITVRRHLSRARRRLQKILVLD